MKKLNTCNNCGKMFTDEPAISRIDNSDICPACGMIEAMDAYALSLKIDKHTTSFKDTAINVIVRKKTLGGETNNGK